MLKYIGLYTALMTVLTCPIAGCGFATPDVDVVGAAAVLNLHALAHTEHCYQPSN